MVNDLRFTGIQSRRVVCMKSTSLLMSSILRLSVCSALYLALVKHCPNNALVGGLFKNMKYKVGLNMVLLLNLKKVLTQNLF